MRATKLVLSGGLWLAMSIACEGRGGGSAFDGLESSSTTVDGTETDASAVSATDAMLSASVSTTEDTDARDVTSGSADSGDTSDGSGARPDIPGEPTVACNGGGGCFAWCGARFIDGSCHRAADIDLDAIDFGRPLCDPLELAIDRDIASPIGESDDDDVRCFLQVLRYGHIGVAEMHFRDTASERSGHLVVEGLGDGYAHLEMRIEGAAPMCGDAIALSARAAHVRDERDPLFDACLDTNDDVDVVGCVLGPAATFYEDHDWIYDVAFPWLTGSCGVP
jgi:hypothetical protein